MSMDDAVGYFIEAASIAAAACGQAGVGDIATPVLGSAASVAGGPLNVLAHPGKWRRGPSQDLPPNPNFVNNGHGDGPSVLTNIYLYRRKVKSFGSTAAGVLGGVSQVPAHGVDAISTSMHLSSFATTSVHLANLRKLADRSKQSKTITDWLHLIQKMKAIKLGTRGVALAAAVIPFVESQTAGGILGAIIQKRIPLHYGEACQLCAMEIHWRAFQEQGISAGLARSRGGGGGGQNAGPASRIAWELLHRRSYTRFLGQYDVATMMKEPAGYMALGDKIGAL